MTAATMTIPIPDKARYECPERRWCNYFNEEAICTNKDFQPLCPVYLMLFAEEKLQSQNL